MTRTRSAEREGDEMGDEGMDERRAKMEEMQKTIILMNEELEALKAPPYVAGTILDIGQKTMLVSMDGQGVYELDIKTALKEQPKKGSRVVVNPQTRAIVDFSEFDSARGPIATVEEANNGRLRVSVKGETRMVYHALSGVKAGDEVILDPSEMLAVVKSDSKKTKYNLEEIPEAPWGNVGGLEEVISKIKSEVELPFIHKDVFARYGRHPAKGILLYGPPGCGKTLIARSIAYNLSKLTCDGGKGQFINIKGPEILDKWVGNSEANIRRVYSAARETAQETGAPVVVFIDEAESVLKTRGSGISSDVYDSIVPQFLAELDGINGNGNVITVLATNREDIIDPAVLRDGRVDRRINIPRPNKAGAEEIFRIYLKGKPLDGLAAPEAARDMSGCIYDDKNVAYHVVSPRDGVLGSFGYGNLVSGALIKGIVDRACGYAIAREIEKHKAGGITHEDLTRAINDEFSENLGFSQTLVRDDWESVFGARGRQYQEACAQGYILLQSALEEDSQSTKLREVTK